MMPVRERDVASVSFARLTKRLYRTLVQCLDHPYPFPALVEALGLFRLGEPSPVFKIAFQLQKVAAPGASGKLVGPASLPIVFEHGFHQQGEYELFLEVMATSEDFFLHFKYDPGKFSQKFMERMAGHFCFLMAQVMADPEKRANDCDLLTPQEIHTLVEEWNATAEDYDQDLGVHEIFMKMAEKHPNRIAAVYEDLELTYQELDQKSTDLALYLKAWAQALENRWPSARTGAWRCPWDLWPFSRLAGPM